MEFYGNYYTDPWLMEKGFNSQRDGILPRFHNPRISFIFVSIPNGMEFYSQNKNKSILLQKVSIPNGMEFYP